MVEPPPIRLSALLVAIAIHAAGAAWAVTAMRPVRNEPARAPKLRDDPPRVVMLFALPPASSAGERRVIRKLPAPAPAATGDESSSEPSPASAPSAGEGLVERTTSSAQLWAWQPSAASLNLAQANRRSVMADLPERPDCDFLNVGPFQCLSLVAKWSLDSSSMVNLRCSQARPSQRYAECGEAERRAQATTELHAQPR